MCKLKVVVAFLNDTNHNLINFDKIRCPLVGIQSGGLTPLLMYSMTAYSWPILLLTGWFCWHRLYSLVSEQRKTLSASYCMAFAI